MALYKHQDFLGKSASAEFDKEHDPGDIVPLSGLYRCMGCGREIATNQRQPFPPQNHHQHTIAQGRIRWKLVVYADHNPK
jgi:hypothetical protein